MRRLRLEQRLREERGMALVMAIGIMTVLGIMIVTIIDYTASNTRNAGYSKSKTTAFTLAEAGINNAVSVLNNPSNNSLDPNILASQTSSIEGGSVTWSGTLDRATAAWALTSTGSIKNPTGPKASNVTRTLTAKVVVVPTYAQPLSNPVWNYLYAGHTGSACDLTVSNVISGSSRLYVVGNLCLSPNSALGQSTVVVGGDLDVSNNAAVGASTNMGTRVEAYVGGNCRYGGAAWVSCTGNQDSRRIYSKLSDGTTIGVNHTPPVVPPPTADFATWYANAIPGPSQSCTTASGATPTFDNNYPSRDNSVATVFDLTPASSYTCRVGRGASTKLSSAINASQTTITVSSASGFPSSSFRIRIDDEALMVTGGFGTTTWTVTRAANATTAATHVVNQTVGQDDAGTSGELSWNATTRTLTVLGTIYIDGSAKVSNKVLNTYNGQGSLYLSGTFLQDGSLCAASSGSTCDIVAWNPNKEMLTIVANGSGGQVNVGDSIEILNDFVFQGALYATNTVELDNNVVIDGPIVGSQILLHNLVVTNSFPWIDTVPVGMPANQAVWAQPNPPESFSG